MSSYMSDKLFLVENPFVSGIPKNVEIWAGSVNNLETLTRTLGNLLVSRNSAYVLIWGELGAGKTYTAEYYNSVGFNSLVQDLAKKGAIHKGFQLLPFPRIVTTIGGKRDIQFLDNILRNFGKGLTGNSLALNVLNRALKDLDPDSLNKYVSRDLLEAIVKETKTAEDFVAGLAKQRFGEELYVSNVQEIIDIFVLTVSLLTSDGGFDHVFFWVDEMEKARDMTNLEFLHNMQFFRECFDLLPKSLTFAFLWTAEVRELQRVASGFDGAVWSRMGYKIELELLTRDAALSYVKKLLQLKRPRPDLKLPTEYYPFTENCIERLLNPSAKRRAPILSPRQINFRMSDAIASLIREQYPVSPQKPVTFEVLSKIVPSSL